MFNSPGLVRACRLCHDQQHGERGEIEHKVARAKLIAPVLDASLIANGEEQALARSAAAVAPPASWTPGGHAKVQDNPEISAERNTLLQNRFAPFFLFSFLTFTL